MVSTIWNYETDEKSEFNIFAYCDVICFVIIFWTKDLIDFG
jgi:hypothetical protein